MRLQNKFIQLYRQKNFNIHEFHKHACHLPQIGVSHLTGSQTTWCFYSNWERNVRQLKFRTFTKGLSSCLVTVSPCWFRPRPSSLTWKCATFPGLVWEHFHLSRDQCCHPSVVECLRSTVPVCFRPRRGRGVFSVIYFLLNLMAEVMKNVWQRKLNSIKPWDRYVNRFLRLFWSQYLKFFLIWQCPEKKKSGELLMLQRGPKKPKNYLLNGELLSTDFPY